VPAPARRMWQALRVQLALLLAACPGSRGHGYLAFPPMRGGAGGSTLNAYCPQCGNGAGICGDGGQWGNSDMLGYTQGPLTTFSPGQVVEFVIQLTAHHRGHFEFSICDKKLGHSTADAQACLNAHRLQRVPPPSDCVPNDARGDCQPIHAEYPERWYLPPGTGTHKMRFRIPSNLQCSSCTLQWRWWTANSCVPAADYGCFFSRLAELGWDASSWCGTMCGTCGSALLQSNSSSTLTRCGEEFRNCADIAVLGSGVQEPAPTPSPAPVTTQSPTTAAPTPGSASTPAPAETMACVPIGDCGNQAWCDQGAYSTWCSAGGAAGQCPAVWCKQEAEPEPESESEPASTVQPSTTSAPSASPETSCLPTNSAYSLYCAEQSAAGLCPSPWCEMGSVALNAESVQTKPRRHSFLGTALIQEASFVKRSSAIAENTEEL